MRITTVIEINDNDFYAITNDDVIAGCHSSQQMGGSRNADFLLYGLQGRWHGQDFDLLWGW